MPAIVAQISRFVDEAFPGWVECLLLDAAGQAHVFVEKVPVVSLEDLTPSCTYPRVGQIACEVVEERRDEAGGTVLLVDTERPFDIESRAGLTRFVLVGPQVIRDRSDS